MRRLLRHAPIALAVAITLGLVAGVTVSGAAFDTYRNAVMADGPVAYWRLGDTNGANLADETGANPGAYAGGYTLGTQGAIWNDPNTAVTFDGVKSYGAVPDAPSLRMSTGVTVEAWARRHAGGVYQPLVGKPLNGQSRFENYSLWINTSNRPAAYFGNGTTYVSVSGPVLDTNWHHLAATYNNATARLYVDGVQVASTNSTVQLTPTTDPVNIGRSASGSYNSSVDLDDVAIYPTALTAARIAAHYSTAHTDAQPPVVTLATPADGVTTSNTTPTFSGNAGLLGGDSASVTVKLWAGTQATGTPVQTLTAARAANGSWSVQPTALSDGPYAARAEQRDDAGNVGTSAVRTLTVDTGPPTASITQSPADPSNSNSASISFTADEPSTFACSLDGGTFSACTSPRTYSNLSDGSHTVRVTATDTGGNTGAPASAIWHVDTVAPSVTITDGPPSTSGSTDASLSFSAGEPGTTQCSLDGAAFSSCTSPQSYSGLADGSHSFRVKATDAAGNTGTAATRSWTVDTTAPSPTLTVPADGSTVNDDTPTFSGAAGRAAGDLATVTVRLYQGSSVGDTPLQTLTATRRSDGTYSVDAASLAEGVYTAQASQQDSLGHIGTSAPVTFTVDILTVDSTPPTVRLREPVDLSFTSDTTPHFSGTAGTDPGDLPGITVNLYTGSSTTGDPFETLTATADGTGAFTTDATAQLPEGTYTAQASQLDSSGNVGLSNARTFTVDTTAPFASITDSPPQFTPDTSPSISFTADEPGVTFACSLDGADFSACTSPAAYTGLADGDHAFRVQATDAAGNVGPVATASWTVDTVAPATTITNGPSDPTSATSATFAFTSSEQGVALRCKLDSGAYASCDSPVTYSDLSDGAHTFKVQATDAAGNAGPYASRTWTVDTAAPVVTLTAPANASSSGWPQPAFKGVGGTAAGDASPVTVRLYSGTSTGGVPMDTLLATPGADGSYSVSVPSFRQPGTYTAIAQQADAAGNTGYSSANTFSITDPVLLTAGDISSCEATDGDTATSDILLAHPDALVVPNGDTTYPDGAPSEYSDCYAPTWGRVYDRSFPTIGDHEYNTPNASGYLNYFQNRLSQFGPAATDPARGWYSFDVGAWHVVSLNNLCTAVGGCDAGSPEEVWLRNDLATHQNECTVAFMHQPRFSSGSVHGSDPRFTQFFQDFYDAGVDVVVSGHDHLYERFLPQTADGTADPAYGVQDFTVGTGGYFFYTFGNPLPNSAVRSTNVYGVLKLSLHSHGWDWQFLPEAGRTFSDSGSAACHGAPPPPPPPPGPSVRAASSNAANAATSLAIPAPAGAQPGDLLLGIVSHQVAQFRNMTPPAGWTAVPNTDVSEGNNARIHAWYRVATAAEPASYTFTLTGGSGQDMSGGILDIKGASTTAPIDASAGQSNGSTAAKPVSAPSVTTSVADTLGVFGGSCSAAVTYLPPTGMSEQWDRSSSGTYKVSTEAATASQPAVGATGVRTATASSTCRSVAVNIAVAPAG